MLDFSDVAGQDSVKEHLRTALRSGRISHAYMLIGEKGLGKQTLADAFAKMLFCEKDSLHPCGSCHACRQVEALTHPDLIHLRHEKPNSIGVDDVREQLAAEVAIRPFSGRKRVFVVPEAEKMTVQAQNALLKTIEEPPEYAVIFLLTKSEEALLETIRSRCVKLKLRPVAERELAAALLRRGDISRERVLLAARFARGIPGLAEQMAVSEEFQKRCEETLELLLHLPQANAVFVNEAAEKLQALYPELRELLEVLRMYYRDLLCAKQDHSGENLIFAGYETRLLRAAKELSFPAAGRILDEINRMEDRLRANVNPELALELLLQEIRQGGRKGK